MSSTSQETMPLPEYKPMGKLEMLQEEVVHFLSNSSSQKCVTKVTHMPHSLTAPYLI